MGPTLARSAAQAYIYADLWMISAWVFYDFRMGADFLLNFDANLQPFANNPNPHSILVFEA